LLFRKKANTLSDNELILLYKKKGDKELVGILFKRYTRFVFAVCMKYIQSKDRCEDAVMEIFEKLFDDLKKHHVTNFKSWLYTVAKNHCLVAIRKSKGREIAGGDDPKIHSLVMENAQNMYHDNEAVLEKRISGLEKELGNLSEEQRICIELFYLKEKSYNEVASITGYTLNQVKSYIQNGKRNLKNNLLGYEE
jgi:RNA polymerase sigma factor (sigma-70 family)